MEADGYLERSSGATQRLIDDCTTKTRFIKVIKILMSHNDFVSEFVDKNCSMLSISFRQD